MLAAKEPEVLEAAVLAAARLRYDGVRPRITAAFAVLHRYRPIAVWGLEYAAKEKNVGGMREFTDHNWGHTRSSQP